MMETTYTQMREERGSGVMQIERSHWEFLKGMCDRRKHCSAALLTS